MTIISRIQKWIAQFFFWWSVKSIYSKKKNYKQVSLSMECTKHLSKKGVNDNMENSPTLERRGCPCTLSLDVPLYPPTTHHFKMESHGNSKTASSVAHRRHISFRRLKSNSSPTPPPPQQLLECPGILESPAAITWE